MPSILPMSNRTTSAVRWADLFPDEFLARQRQRSVVYLPMGLCEPHGQVAVLGLDTIKADHLCDEAARRFGGIVAPTQGYHIHESGYHAPWLAEVVGNRRPYLTALPPHVLLYSFLYQLRAFHNANFRVTVVISGHAGGNQDDLRLAARHFARISDMPVLVFADPELVAGQFTGDHAGRYELSQLLAINPALVNLDRTGKSPDADSLGRFAVGHDASEATAEEGQTILDASFGFVENVLAKLDTSAVSEKRPYLSYPAVESVWDALKQETDRWQTLRLQAGQQPTPPDSMWRAYENTEDVFGVGDGVPD